MHGMIVLTHWQAPYNQIKPNQTRLSYFTSVHHSAYSHWQKKHPPFPFLFSFLSCATDDDLKQTNFGYMMRILGWDIFFDHRSNLIGCL
jgi:hypothetical protein